MLPDYETLDITLDGHVATVFLDRPDKANAMNAAMWEELQRCFEALDENPEVRAVVLAAHGKHFCAGLDLGMFAEAVSESHDPARRAEQMRRKILRMQGNLTAIETCRVPVLAAIHHTCIGGGVDMTCCADMRYATEDAFFAVREIDIGMTADVGTLQRLPKLIPDGVVRELAYTGRTMSAAEALSWGFINRVFPDQATMLAEVVGIAHEIARKSPLAIRGSKEMLVYSRDHSVAEGLNYIATWNAGMLSLQDIQTGVEAQTNKTTAEFER